MIIIIRQELADFEEMPDGPKIDYQGKQSTAIHRDSSSNTNSRVYILFSVQQFWKVTASTTKVHCSTVTWQSAMAEQQDTLCTFTSTPLWSGGPFIWKTCTSLRTFGRSTSEVGCSMLWLRYRIAINRHQSLYVHRMFDFV